MACTKEITDELIVFFKFPFSETTSEAFLNTRKDAQFTVNVGGAVNEGDYQIKFSITKGAGSYFLNNQLITENQFTDLPVDPVYAIEYVGAVDVIPVISILSPSINVSVGEPLVETVSASDNFDGNITSEIVFGVTFANTDTVGTYTRTYNVVDSSDNAAIEVVRTNNSSDQDFFS